VLVESYEDAVLDFLTVLKKSLRSQPTRTMMLLMRILIVALILLAAVMGQSAENAVIHVVLCAPGYPGSTAEAQPTMNAFAFSLANNAGLAKTAVTAIYEQSVDAGLAELTKPETSVALVTLPFLLQNGEALKLVPRMVWVQAAGATTEVWTLVAQKGRVSGPAALAGFTIVSTAGYAPSFVRQALSAWGTLPESTKIMASAQVLSGLRKAAGGQDVALLLDGNQAASLSSLPFAADLETVARSEPLPVGFVCSVDNRINAGRWKSVEQALSKMGTDPQAAAVLQTMRTSQFTAVDEAVRAQVRRLQTAKK